jgi:hypothetical protein
MDVCPASACTIEWILFIFVISDFMRYKSVPGEYEHSSFKNRGLSDVFQDTAWQFTQKWH